MRKPLAVAILAMLATGAAAHAGTTPESNTLLFTAQPFNTQLDTLAPPTPFTLQSTSTGLQIVQFLDTPQAKWLDMLAARGITPIQYVANNGYIVWVDQDALVRLTALRDEGSFVQYAEPLQPFLKVDTRLSERLAIDPGDTSEVELTVQIYRHAGDAETRRFIAGLALLSPEQQAPLGDGKLSVDWSPILAFANTRIRARLSDVPAIAARPDVTFVGEWSPRKMMDEKQDLIMAGDIYPGPGSQSYLQYLIDKGFSQNPDDYPIVDVTDSPIHEGGTGPTVVNTADPALHVGGDLGAPSRVAYFNNCSSTPDTSVGAVDGHGALNGGIVAGYDQTTGVPYQDADGHQLGLGVNPFGRVASTAIFVPGYNISRCDNSDQGVIKSVWQKGGRINTNSWGATYPPTTYDSSDQAYDAGTRDADPTQSGNQELIQIFSAANDGPGSSTVSSPAAGKNVITVGASENLRPYWNDGCGIGPSGADDPMDVISFSSRGPAPGNRVKPEVIAPGTHIQARASIFSGYNGDGVCDKFYPPGQTLFASSSGTSHSTPAIAGMASLAWHWIEAGGLGTAAGTLDEIDGSRAPSPAMMKAWLMAHPTYLTGVSANDNLPSNSQGYGMPTLSVMFDDTPKVLLDQSELFTTSGDSRNYVWSAADPSKPVRIALTWTDAPGALGTSPQVNDLDLVVVAGGQTYLGNQFTGEWSTPGGSADTRNNYEAVFLPAGTASDVDITIKATAIVGDGVPGNGIPLDQDFAVVCSNCARAPTFTMSTPETRANICAGDDYSATIDVGSLMGFNDPVSFSLSGVPAGANGAIVPPVLSSLPGSVQLSITDSSTVAAGQYLVAVDAVAGSEVKGLDFDLTYSAGRPDAPALSLPANGATNTPLTPTLTWLPAAQAVTYLVELADDPAFTFIVASAEVADTAWTVPTELDPSHRYYWRVKARNACGESLDPQTPDDVIFADGFERSRVAPPDYTYFQFATLALPGSCGLDSTEVELFSDDMESGAPGWTHSAGVGSDSWTLGSTAHSGNTAWQANNFAAVTDQRLVSPSITLPSGMSTLSLIYWDQQSMESSGSGCWDGALLEVSTDGGSNWSQITSGLLTLPYDGLISSSYGNPLGGNQGWCGNPRDYTRSVVDLGGYAGQTVQFRFRMGNDTSVTRPNPGWAIDDVKVIGCSDD